MGQPTPLCAKRGGVPHIPQSGSIFQSVKNAAICAYFGIKIGKPTQRYFKRKTSPFKTQIEPYFKPLQNRLYLAVKICRFKSCQNTAHFKNFAVTSRRPRVCKKLSTFAIAFYIFLLFFRRIFATVISSLTF